MSIYADSSFFVSCYVQDQHSLEARRRIAAHPALWFTPLHHVEWTHAVAQHVFRGFLTAQEAESIYKRFGEDRGIGLWDEVNLPDTVFESSIALARKYIAQIGSRTLDTLHVAAALELGAKEFWTFDDRQKKLAKVVGLKAS